MVASNVAYQLRPQKFVDRGLFFDLLSRVMPRVGVERYAFISMGANHLVDHGIAFRKLGVTSLYSFDGDERVAERQLINRPTHDTTCRCMHSSDLPEELEGIMAGFPNATNFALWLDFTANGERLAQIGEYENILGKMIDGDILRVTLNAHVDTLGKTKAYERHGHASPGHYRLAKLRSTLGNYVPHDAEAVGEGSFPRVLARCLQVATQRAELASKDTTFMPLLLTTYADGHRMVTLTVVARSAESGSAYAETLENWRYLFDDWDISRMVDIRVPNLSSREKLRVDALAPMTAREIVETLGLFLGETPEESIAVIESYLELRRFYPVFQHVDL